MSRQPRGVWADQGELIQNRVCRYQRALDSLWDLIPAGLTVCTTILRTALEDETLQRGLDGYRNYARRVRHHLFPRSRGIPRRAAALRETLRREGDHHITLRF